MATKGTVTLDRFADEITSRLKEWKVDVDIVCEEASDATIRNARKHIKDKTKTSGMGVSNRLKNKPKEQYVNCYVTRKPDRKRRFLRALWNTQYQLSHLLEDGHDSYNQWNSPNSKKLKPSLPRPYTIKKSRYAGSVGRKHTHEFRVWEETEKWTGDSYYRSVSARLRELSRRISK